MTRVGAHRPGEGSVDSAPSRVSGVDAARGIALIGMFVAHVSPEVESADAEAIIAIADERPRLLFALTAGMGLGLISGGIRPIVEGRSALRRQIAIRAVILIALGLLIWATLDPLVFVILDVYGVAFLLMLPLLFLRARVALGSGFALLAVTPALAEAGARTDLVATVRETPLKFLSDWIVGGAYPVIVWVPVMLIGLAVVRMGLGSPRLVAVMALVGTVGASVLLPVAARLPAPEAASETGWPVLLRASVETLGNVGIGVVVVAGMLALTAFAPSSVRRVNAILLAPFIAMGAMPLSIYTLHLVVIALAIRNEDGVATDDSWALLLGLVAGSMVFALAWRRQMGRGPLEQLLRWASGRDRPDAAASSPW